MLSLKADLPELAEPKNWIGESEKSFGKLCMSWCVQFSGVCISLKLPETQENISSKRITETCTWTNKKNIVMLIMIWHGLYWIWIWLTGWTSIEHKSKCAKMFWKLVPNLCEVTRPEVTIIWKLLKINIILNQKDSIGSTIVVL